MSELSRNVLLQGLILVLLSAVPAVAGGAQGVRALDAPAAVKVRIAEGYGKLPLSFEANQGQTDGQVKFLSRGSGYTLFLTSTEAVLALSKPAGKPSAEQPMSTSGTVVRMKLIGANSASQITGLQELPGKSNYFSGNDPSKWRTNIPSYAQVKYEHVYPGVDLIYYGNQRQLEYDFVVAPGADPGVIKLAFEGARSIERDASGNLILRTAGGDLRMHKPVVYQEVGGVKRPVPGRYVVADKHQVGFHVAAYDPSKPLVIDPVLVYSTFLGGSLGDTGFRIAVDSAGNAYVTGGTNSINFPTTAGAVDPSFNDAGDAFVTKLNPAGSALVYSTYLGGSGNDFGIGIAVDSAGNAYVTGTTDSTNLPTTLGAFDRSFNGGSADIFVTKLDPTGSAVVYSTYLGGSGFERPNGIAVDSAGNAYVMGRGVSANFPTTAGAFQTVAPGGDAGNPQDAFVTKLNPAGSALVYSTFLGGNRNDEGVGLALDSAGNAYVTGFTSSTNFPTTAGAFQETFNGPGNAGFVTKLNPAGSDLVYSTYLGNSFGIGIAVDSAGNAYVTGQAFSNFPTTAGAFQTTQPTCTPLPPPLNFLSCSVDAFVAKIDPSQSGIASLVYSTYLGGSGGFDQGNSIAVDSAGNAYVTGTTNSDNFPTTADAFQTTHGGGVGFVRLDAFLTKLNPAGSALVYSTYLGGNGNEDVRGIGVDSAGNAYVAGSTGSANFPTTDGAFDRTFNGGDAFVAKFSFNQPPVADAGADQTVSAGANCQALVALNGSGSSDPNGDTLTFTWTGAFGTATGATPTVTLPLGTHTITLTVDDGNGGTASDTVVVTVTDSTGPIISVLTVNPGSLWPPNHQMVPVAVTAAVADNCAGPIVCQVVSVSSNEPIDGLGDGDTAPDWELTGDLSVSLRAERSGRGGRIYTITVKCTDATGNSTTKTITVTVAHDQAKK
jgi:hypothetical protein